MKNVFATALLFALSSIQSSAHAADLTIHLLFRAFIADDGTGSLPDTTRTQSGALVVQAPDMLPLMAAYPSLTGTCFSTDERGFSNDPTASARTTVELVLEVDGNQVEMRPASGRDMKRTGKTRNVDCVTGADVQAPRQATTDGFEIGDVGNNGSFSVVFVKAAAFDPFYDLPPPLRAPDVDFSFTMRIDHDAKQLSINGSTDNFPHFEGYVSLNGGSWTPILQRNPPPGATALSLIDASLGLNTTNFSFELGLD